MDEQPQTKSWWGRNWLWVVPVGCLLPVFVCCGGGVAIFMVAMSGMKSIDPYNEAITRAKASDELRQAIGEPIEEAYLVMGNVNVSNGSGTANINTTVTGPKGSANVVVTANKAQGEWTYSTMQAVVQDTGDKIDLLTEATDN